MDIEVKVDGKSLSVDIENPHRFDVSRLTDNIINFGRKLGIDLAELQIEKLIQRMIRGVAGCEGGCPSDAMSLARKGFGDFRLSYVEGGILTAVHTLDNGRPLEVKVFPEFE